MKHILLLITFIASLAALANDGVYFVSGNQLVPLAETDISVRKEVLTIVLCDDGDAEVDVQYEFENGGKEKTVVMGFEANAPYNAWSELTADRHHPYIYDFTVTMNGRMLEYSNDICVSNSRDFTPLDLEKWKLTEECGGGDALYNAECDSAVGYSYVYKFDARFREGLNTVHHTYSYRMSYGIATVFEVLYELSPALRWANHTIDDFTLRIVARNTAKNFYMNGQMFPAEQFRVTEGMGKIRTVMDCNYETNEWNVPLTEVTLRNGTIEWHTTHFTPEEELFLYSADELRLYHTKDRFDSNHVPHFLLGEFYDRSENYSPMCIAGYYESGEPDIDTRILRNLPFAHRGYVFESKDLQDYFSQFWWYMPDATWKASTADFTIKELGYLYRDDTERKHEGKVVVDEDGIVLGRLLRTNADTYTVSVQDYGEVPRRGNKAVTYRASDGKGVVFATKSKVNVRQQPSTSAPIVGKIILYEGELPECYPCLGYKDGWYCIDFDGKRGYVRGDLMSWDSICTI